LYSRPGERPLELPRLAGGANVPHQSCLAGARVRSDPLGGA